MSVELVKIQLKEKNILDNLIHLYLHDLSTYTNQLSINDQGVFIYENLECFFVESNLTPFFIMLENQIIGFILFVKTIKNNKLEYCINDLFLLNRYRGRGLGKEAVKQLLSSFPGSYYVLQLEQNQPAIQFWKAFYRKYNLLYTEKVIVEDGETCIAQTFYASSNLL
ncbi:GNAT family N-acetyltransferase [Aneurinibacillus migulanus]|uniref:Predicted acetyltransferase n=1 Tax=Aneurinibacillus migulanus TaxID=47500 RepID=A0A0D1V0A2_ANEMI|nr:GNAT family N-acetyltransferase [Aneurinibacillus migulanus]KIV52754.1 hypothetical protein TS65_21655 [Aneurinibacillus migulanus]KON96102.1 hypothetical protein AF333_12025 [Aneurinibacillus migulanus]MED0896682.1 GNAT family N-acetyltransferase [Aneurinibacillus migulanus]MED1617241.1 GNAT family N-acetyltransferase [Aneurinibacillus migulanus]SDK43532.1 Predicted acetyltransferase [Aneurinibacillus migulanus]